MPDFHFQELSGEALRQQQELLHDYENMMLRWMLPFQGIDPARQSAETTAMFSYPVRHSPSLQHWAVCAGTSRYCLIDDCSALTFPLVEFSVNRDAIIIRFTVPAAQFRGPIRTVLRLQEGDIFGDILEWQYHRDNGAVALNVTLQLHPSSFQMSAQRGEAVRCTFEVPISRYRHNMTREELLLDEQRHEPTYYQRLERAGLVPDRLEALQELMQGQSLPTYCQERSQPPIKQPAICNGCRNLHGQYHGGTLLVCGMHPYGNGENCSDFEGF